MAAKYDSTEKLKAGCRLRKVCGFECEPDSGGDLFSREWEVFVIKHDKRSGKLIGKPTCCALEPV